MTFEYGFDENDGEWNSQNVESENSTQHIVNEQNAWNETGESNEQSENVDTWGNDGEGNNGDSHGENHGDSNQDAIEHNNTESFAHDPEQLHEEEDFFAGGDHVNRNVNDSQNESSNDASSPNVYNSASNNLNFIAKARMERMEQIEKHRKESEEKRMKMREASQTYKSKFREERNHRVETKRKTNRDNQALFYEDNESNDNTWEDVLRYVDLSSTQNQAKDTSRLKKLLFTLKNKN